MADDISWEVIVIDNASTDDTCKIAAEEWAGYTPACDRFVVTEERRQGLSFAREKGIRCAAFDYVVFCDDDNWLDERYLETAYRIIDKDSRIAALGGQSSAVSTVTFPDWFESLQNNYAVGRQSPQSGDVSVRGYVWGSGMVIRKALYQQAFRNFPSLLTGRKGKELTSGEDSELCLRFLLMGYRIHYSEDLQFVHFISPERLTRPYFDKMYEGFVQAYEQLAVYRKFLHLRVIDPVAKFRCVLKSGIKIMLTKIAGVRRWPVGEDELNMFVITGFRTGGIDEHMVNIKKLTSAQTRAGRAN